MVTKDRRKKMELYDEQFEQKKSPIPIGIGIALAVLVLLTIVIVIGIIYLKNSITIININQVRNSEVEEIFYIETNEQGAQLYLPIIKMAKFCRKAAGLIMETDYKMKTSFDDQERLLELLILELAQEARNG